MAAVIICSDFGAQENKITHYFPHHFPLSDETGCHDLQFLNVVLNQFFSLLFHLHQVALVFFFTFCHKGGVMCISEVIGSSLGNLDSSLCFIHPGIYHDVHCI